MNARLGGAERAIQKLAGENVKLAERVGTIRRWYERHGNGQKPS